MIAPIRKDNIKNSHARPRTKLEELLWIVVHYPDAPGWSAQDTRDYFEIVTEEVSTQYSVDETECIEIIPPDEVAWSVGRKAYWDHHGSDRPYGEWPNYHLINMEVSHGTDGVFTQKAIDNAAWLCAWLCRQYDRDPMHLVIRHHDVTGKICPKYFVDNTSEWEVFRNHVKALVIEEIYFDAERGDYL
jgi:N-acetylmuramoyl-L-alanine amidase CwlA